MTDSLQNLNAEFLQQELAWAQRLAMGLVRDASEADDLVQEAWLQGLRGSWSGGHPPRAWMAVALRNLARLRGRGRANRLRRELAQPIGEPAPSAEEIVLRVEACRALVDGLLHLSSPYRDVLFLRFVEERSAAEIAGRLGVPAGTIRSQTLRGLQLLKKRLGDRVDRRSLALLAALPFPKSTGFSTGLLMNAKPIAGVAALLLVGLIGYRSMASTPDPQGEGAFSEGLVLEGPAQTPKTEELVMGANPDRERAPVGQVSSIALPAEPVRLNVVDARTGEAVCGLRLALEDGDGRREELVTDTAGDVTSSLVYPSQTLTVHLLGEGHADDIIQVPSARTEARRYVPQVLYEHTADALVKEAPRRTLEVPVGPTLFLGAVIPTGYGAEDILGILTTRDAATAFDKLYARGVVPEGGAPVGTVRLRFAPLAHLIGGGAALRLRAGTSDGAWYCEADIESPFGQQFLPNIEFTGSAGLHGHLYDGTGEALPRQFVQLHPAPGGKVDDASPRPAYALANEQGEFVFRWIEPGLYNLRVNAENAEPYSEEILLVQGSREMDLRLQADSLARNGRIAGVVESSSGRFKGPLHGVLVTLEPEEEAGFSRSLEIAFAKEEDAKVLGRFSLEGLREDAKYRLMIAAEGFAVEPRDLDVAAGQVDLKFHVNDLASTGSLDVRATSRKDNKSLSAFEVRLSFPGAAGTLLGSRVLQAESGLAIFDSIPLDEPFSWVVTAVGYAPAFGDERSASKDGSGTHLMAQLEPGWGARIIVVAESGEPLGGAQILLDGEVQGVTDSEGLLHASYPRVPSRLEVQLEGWVQIDKTPSNANSPFRPWDAIQRVRLRSE